jgi:hypothetical protein
LVVAPEHLWFGFVAGINIKKSHIILLAVL